MNAQSLVAKVWNFAHVLRDQGVSYQAYISQISYLLFLKMDEERVTWIGEASMLPDGARWSDIKDLSGEALNATYVKLLDKLSKREESEKFKRFPLETLLARDKVNLDIFWVKDHALDNPDLLPPPDEVAAEIVESLELALDRFRNVAKALSEGPV